MGRAGLAVVDEAIGGQGELDDLVRAGNSQIDKARLDVDRTRAVHQSKAAEIGRSERGSNDLELIEGGQLQIRSRNSDEMGDSSPIQEHSQRLCTSGGPILQGEVSDQAAVMQSGEDVDQPTSRQIVAFGWGSSEEWDQERGGLGREGVA
jgi:hypothetical protein